MLIGGLEKLSLIDFPGEVATVVFTKSCNFRCHFCYNPMLVLAEGEGESKNREEDYPLISEEDLLLFLQDRVGKISGIVISGGEPTLQKDLKEFIQKLRAMGFKIKLDSNGTKPEVIRDLIKENLLDYIAMDLKSSLVNYEKVVGTKVDISSIVESIKMLKTSGVPYEFRTTLVPGLHTAEDILAMSQEIAGAKNWFLQKFKSDTDLVNSDFKERSSFTDFEMKEMLQLAQKHVPNCKIRD